MRYSKEKIKELTGVDIDTDFGYIEVLSETQHKSKEQNRLFHSLLRIFWESGCSSFESSKNMRFYYKEIAHLIEYVFQNDLEEETKQMLWKAIKLLPLKETEKKKVIELLRGKTLIEHSWAESTKGMAKIAIDELLNDMHQSGVISSSQGKKFEEVLKKIGQWYYD